MKQEARKTRKQVVVRRTAVLDWTVAFKRASLSPSLLARKPTLLATDPTSRCSNARYVVYLLIFAGKDAGRRGKDEGKTRKDAGIRGKYEGKTREGRSKTREGRGET
jgi:hypothetical protein